MAGDAVSLAMRYEHISLEFLKVIRAFADLSASMTASKRKESRGRAVPRQQGRRQQKGSQGKLEHGWMLCSMC